MVLIDVKNLWKVTPYSLVRRLRSNYLDKPAASRYPKDGNKICARTLSNYLPIIPEDHNRNFHYT